jgi:hypothetical protein
MANGQLTDGGPSLTPEFPSCVAGPPFGAALCSVFCSTPLFPNVIFKLLKSQPKHLEKKVV